MNRIVQKCIYSDKKQIHSTSISGSNCALQTVLKVGSSSGVSVLGLWNNAGVHCDKGNQLYRHDFIDRMENNCVRHVSIQFKGAETTYIS